MNTTTTTLTWGEGVLAIDALVSAELDQREYPQEAFTNAVFAINENLQHRDYFLGLASEENMEVMTMLAVKVITRLDEPIDRVPFLSCLSAFYYEVGANQSAHEALATALQLNSEYSLAGLLRRVYGAGWNGKEFGAMRRELHPKVVEGIKEKANLPITEGND